MPKIAVLRACWSRISRALAAIAPVELVTRGERRRRWSIEQKREIVAESLSPDTTPTEAVRKHAVSSGLLYTWRQQFHLFGDRACGVIHIAAQVAGPCRST